jgi:DNA-binding winged helix-turn-helix (wHTH) protein/tetratricopeptide (TPR) repeat protein
LEAPPARIYQFGPFQVNSSTGELLKDGQRIRLQDQPFRLLVVLLENANRAVTRDEIQNRIWQGNTFVDFDSGLRVAVRKLREALGDSAESPVYIETLPKRGYRLIVPVTIQEPERPVREDEPQPAKHLSRSAIAIWALIAVLVLAALTLATFVHRPRKLPGGATIVLADFANSTGDPVFDGALRQGIAVQLEQSPSLSLVSDERIQGTLHMMGLAPGSRLDAQRAREVCERTASSAVLEGSIDRLGSAYVVGLRARDCHSGEVLDQEQAQAAKKEDVLNALDHIASRFRERAGESLSTLTAHDVPLVEATTSSLEALKSYSMGWQVVASQGEGAALPFFKHAVETDPQFAAAYAALAIMYGSTEQGDLAAESVRKAYELRAHATANERYFITAYYEGRVLGNQQKALQTCQEWIAAYPAEWRPHSFLAGFVYPILGNFDGAIEESKKMAQMDVGSGVPYTFLAYSYFAENRVAEGEEALRSASSKKIEVPAFAVARFDGAFLRGDQEAMNRELAGPHDDPTAEDDLEFHRAFVLAYSGRLRQARKVLRDASDSARQRGNMERAATFTVMSSVWDALFGEAGSAKTAGDALKIAHNREIEYGTALAFAAAGDSARALAMANDLEQHFPEDTSVHSSYLPVIRALVALHERAPDRAVQALQMASPFELGTPRSWLQGFFGALYPVYVRGEAYLANHQGSEAAAEFRKVVDHRGLSISDPIGAVAWLQLGRAYASIHETAKAKVAYRHFLDIWKDADPELPLFKQARAESLHLS